MIDWCEFSPKQQDFIRHADAKLCIADGAVRSGKTISCTVKWLDYIATGPQGDLAMLGKSLGTLKRNVLNDLFDIVGPKHSRWVDRQQGELQIYNRRIYAIGAANEEAEGRIRGATFAGAYCDEANLYPQSVWMQLQARLSIPGAQTFANCNPDSPYHWFYKEVITNDKIDSKKRWQFYMDDNLSLTDEYKDQLKSQFSGVFYRRFIKGEWCVAEGLIYDSFQREKHVQHFDYAYLQKHAIRFFIGCDQGTSTTTSWSMFVELNDKPMHIHKISEYYYDAIKNKKQKSDEEFMTDFLMWQQEFYELARTRGGFWMVYADPAASSWDAALTKHQVKHQHADNDVKFGIATVSGLLTMNCYTMEPTCINTIEEYETYSWDANAQLKGEDKPVKTHDHACDSDRYGIHTYMKGRMSGIYRMRRS